jgi:hypothetical protein
MGFWPLASAADRLLPPQRLPSSAPAWGLSFFGEGIDGVVRADEDSFRWTRVHSRRWRRNLDPDGSAVLKDFNNSWTL